MWYEVDYNRLIQLLLPVWLRKLRTVSFLEALFYPIRNLHYSWSQMRNNNLYKLSHNSQVCYLRAALNDEFDSAQRRIKLLGIDTYQRTYIYTEAELKPRYLGTLYLYDKSVYDDTGVDFIVQIPTGLAFDIFQMKFAIDFYKMVTMRYKIINEQGQILG